MYNRRYKHNEGENDMLWSIISWIVVGALAGWIASKIMKTDAQQGGLANIVVGILGAFIGGFIVQMLTGDNVDTFSVPGLLVAILGAVILLWIVKAVRK
ncbi:MAG: GlsB/YeaQ/YmgE family stress response membrane protein [Candidatus Saccharimonadales bacterium]